MNSGLQLSSPDDEIDEEAPLAFSPARPSLESRLERLEQERDTPANKLKRRIFVGNIPGIVRHYFISRIPLFHIHKLNRF